LAAVNTLDESLIAKAMLVFPERIENVLVCPASGSEATTVSTGYPVSWVFSF